MSKPILMVGVVVIDVVFVKRNVRSVQINVGSKNSMSKKNFRQTNFGSKRVRSKKVVVKKNFPPKNKVQKYFGPKKILGKKKCWVQKILDTKIFGKKI